MKYFKFLPCVLIVIIVIFTFTYGNAKISKSKEIKKTPEYQGVITLWHIDTFEGGKGSRKQFLESVAKQYEKNNKGLLIMVVEHTINSAYESIKNGNQPDIVSYGLGVDYLSNLLELSEGNFNGGKIANKTYAKAWCRGGYALIFNPKKIKTIDKIIENLVVSQNTFTQPLLALLEDDYTVKNLKILSPMDAYLDFVSGKTDIILGTQRDINRLFVRQMQVGVVALNNYNDLYQYISVTSNKSEKIGHCKNFIDYLLSQGVQASLSKIGLLSTNYTTEGQIEHLNLLQEVSSKSTLSFITTSQNLIEYQQLAYSSIKGSKEAYLKLKKVLIHS